MDDFAPYTSGRQTDPHDQNIQTVDSDQEDILGDPDNPNEIVTYAPKESFRLGYFDVMCLVMNRMIVFPSAKTSNTFRLLEFTLVTFKISNLSSPREGCIFDTLRPGDASSTHRTVATLKPIKDADQKTTGTGIFNSPQRVMQNTQSTGASLLLWFAGTIYCLSGVHVYIEYGLNIPRYTINGVEQSVPRSGGDLNYLQYVYRKPAYRKNTVLLSTCLFGIGFIALGNMAGNCLSFASRVLFAAGNTAPDAGAVRGIAIGVAILTCFIHTFSRRGGIWLNNMLAIVKVMILLLIIVTAIVVAGKGLETTNVITQNTRPSNAFKDASNDANGYAHAFLAIVFSFSGFEQPNYVMGEISRPRRKHPVAMILGVSTVVLLYMAVNISYMVVVPKQLQESGNVAQTFFELTFGTSDQVTDSTGAAFTNSQGSRIFNGFLAISSLGNIIVMTYTAARVKQEIAKEGIIPCAKFFAQDGDMSLGRLLHWFENRGMFHSLLRMKWFSPEQHRERTPVGAFVLHLISCFILIFATWKMKIDDAYTLLTTLSAYTINCFFGVFLGLGILILRFRGPPKMDANEINNPTTAPRTWSQMTGKHINPVLSVLCATIYTIGGLWPIITTWVKPSIEQALKWWLTPTISWSIIGGGVIWFIGFVAIAWRRKHKRNEVFVVEKKPEFESADDSADAGEKVGRGSGGYVLVHETVYLSWVADEFHSLGGHEPMGFENHTKNMPMQSTSPYAGTDFEGFSHGQQQEGGYGTGFRP
ncbi:hypothetical protein FZEAL_770 [Fusarium zealandicum]|uniref:High-affinity methionine permease n=1 Tax=Fusarium zealandicum TaxID=1053134 RepID=A0A8H4UU35_9HYPO|nr:hypothetical protein FZEAL_770 [Fusarium zealandicum]